MGVRMVMDKGWSVVSLANPRVRRELRLHPGEEPTCMVWLLRGGEWAVAVVENRETLEYGWALLWRGEGERPPIAGLPYYGIGFGRTSSRPARAAAQQVLYKVMALAVPRHHGCRCCVDETASR